MKKMLLFTIVITAFAACKVSWVPDYSTDIESEIVNTAKLTDKLYLEMLELPEAQRTYTAFSKEYLEIEVEINAIKLKNEARKNNTEMLAIVKNVKDHFVQYKKEHKEQVTLSDGEIQVNEAYMQGFWRPLLQAERGLKTK